MTDTIENKTKEENTQINDPATTTLTGNESLLPNKTA